MQKSFKDFNVKHSEIISDVFIFSPTVSRDKRGTIYTTFYQNFFNGYIPNGITFKHDKFSESKKNVLRGLHGDNKTWKLVTCIFGEIFQVVVDCRPESETYLKWDKFIINHENKLQVLLPPKFANGYLVLSDRAIYHYKLAYRGEYNDVEKQFVIKWNDPRLCIKWPIKNPIVLGRDQ